MHAGKPKVFAMNKQYVNAMKEARESGADGGEDADMPDEPPAPASETHKTKPKRSGDWNYNQIRSSFISAFRKETECDYATAKSQWDRSETKKSILGPLSLPELKRRKFVGKTCEKNPWA